MTSQLEQLNTQVATIRTNIDDIGNLPDKVDQFCGMLAMTLRSGYAGPGLIAYFSTEQAIDDIYDDRDAIKASIKEAWEKLDQTNPTLEVPGQFLVMADEWRNVKGALMEAQERYEGTLLSTTWEGDAAVAYAEIRMRQALALIKVPLACEEIAKSLEALASAELALYIELATKSREMVAEVTKVVGEYASAIAGMAMPWDIGGMISALSALVQGVENVKTLILGVVASIATSSAAKIQENNMIGQQYSIIEGVPNQKWPAAVSERYTGGARDAIGDAAPAHVDGDASGWNPGATTVSAY